MSIESIPLPPDLREVLLLKVPEAELTHWATEALVVEAAREGFISRRKAATLLGYDAYDAREAFFERHRLIEEYSLEMLEMDRRALEKLESHS